MDFNEMMHLHHHRRPAPPSAPKHFTATLIPPGHHLWDFWRRWHFAFCHHHHHHHHHGDHMSTVVFAWQNATSRQDGSALSSSEIASSVVSQVNDDGSTTAVTTVTGNGNTATIDAPVAAGTYNYQVVNIDTNGNIGAAAQAAAPVVIVGPVTSAPAAPSGFTATLTP